MFIMFDSCSRQSRMENLPDSNFFAISFCRSGLAIAMSCLQGQLLALVVMKMGSLHVLHETLHVALAQ
jgi:hypothetical protein